MDRLFAYGTLLGHGSMRGIIGRRPRSRPATLPGFRTVAHPNGPWLLALPDPGGRILGRLFEGLEPEEIRALDEYEGVREGLYRRSMETVQVGRERLQAWAYIKV